MISYTYALLVLALVSFVGVVAHTWRVRRVFMRGTSVLGAQLGAAQVAIEEARAQKDRYFQTITEFEKQRNSWHQLYVDQSIGHGNAQNLMMDTIEQMGKVLSSKGVRFQIPRVLHEVRAEFLEKYEMPARGDELAQKKSDPPLAS